MKLNGKSVPRPSNETVVFPRAEGDLVFVCQAVFDYSEFEALCPEPKVPEEIRPGGIKAPNPKSPKYEAAVLEHSQKQQDWMMIQSLSATPGIEWEDVKLEDPETWNQWRPELSKALALGELLKLQTAIIEVNALSDTKMNEARERFLAGERGQGQQT